MRFEPPKSQHDDEVLTNLPFIVRVINYTLPAGDPVRRALPGAVAAVQQYLDDKSTVLPFGLAWGTADYEKFDVEEILGRFTQVLGKPSKKNQVTVFDDKFIMAAVEAPFVQLVFRTKGLVGQDAMERLVAASSLTFGWEGTGEAAIPMAHIVEELRGAPLNRLVEINRDNPLDEGVWEQDPRQVARQVVQAVQKQLKLSDDAATLYLQLLALPDPTNTNVRKWNDWSPKQLKQAAAELVDTDHVVQAKRREPDVICFCPAAGKRSKRRTFLWSRGSCHSMAWIRSVST